MFVHFEIFLRLCFCHFSLTVQPFRLYVFMFYGLLYLHYSNSPPSSAKVKNERCFTSSPRLCLHGVDRDILHFFFVCVHCAP